MRRRLCPPHPLRLARLPSWRQAFLLIVAAAFLLQGYVTQTHIHPLAQPLTISHGLASWDADASAKADKPDKRGVPRDRLPANEDPAKCPLCQAVGHAGQFVWPSEAVYILPQLAAAIVPFALTIARTPPPESHNWQGRAPPHS